MDNPGLKKRLNHAFTRNIAETGDQHPYPELQTPAFELERSELWQRCQDAGEALGWRLESSDEQAGSMHWVVTTPLWKFRDDLTLDIESSDDGYQRLRIRSASRKGTGDLGANAHHIKVYLKQLR